MTDTSNEIIIDSKDIEVIIDKDVSLIDNNIDVKTLEPEYEITINRKEYNVVGDELYIPKRYEDAPQWIRDVINNVTDVALAAKISEINNLTQSLNNLIDELEVAKNTYTMSVVSSNDINERINTAITTLNSSVMESDATILGLATTRVTPEQAKAISIDAIRTSLNDTISGNSLGSIISGMQSTTTTGDYTNAQSIEVLQSTIEGNADSTASAINTINTFAGIDSAGAYTYTGLTGYLVDPNTGMIGGGQSELQNTITTTGDNVEAKFEYGSNIKIGGKYHNAGFGLKTTMTGGDGTIADPYNSEFWINAEKFKFTNNSMSGQATPFTIDATGLQPKITFNGLVTFGSGQTGTIEEAISSTIETVQVGDKNINISDNLIPTTSLVSDINNAGYQFIGSPIKSMQTGISTFSEAQVTLTSGSECYSPYVDEITVPYYYRFGITGVTNVDSFKIITIDSANQETEHTLLVTLNVEVPELNPLNWYIVEGIINPIGGNSSPSGAIRDSLNNKVGRVNNYPMPSSVTKLLLGWTLPCTISRMKLCKVTADTITESYATTDYINEVVSSSGYVRPSEVADAINNNTTTIDGSKITTGTILADKINTTGLIAENISGDAISGKNISGGTINGAVIEGVVINGAVITGATLRASYLDLDGEIEVLTNFYLCLSGNTNGVPAAALSEGRYRTYSPSDIDAVPSSAYFNIYRIPSMSTVSEPYKQVSGTIGYSALHGKIMSYNNANSGTNIKAVKIRPTFNIVSPINLALGTINSTVNIYLGSRHLLRVIVDDIISSNHYDDSITANCYSSYWGTNEIRVRTDGSKSLSITGVPIFDFIVTISIVDGIRKFIISSNPKVSTIPFDWTSGSLVIESTGEIVTKTLGPQIQINNMI